MTMGPNRLILEADIIERKVGMTKTAETFQLSLDAAEAYEARFVPALFGEWAPLLVDAVGMVRDRSVLDIACGTGVVAREVDRRMGGRGRVVGLDINEGMLTVARRLSPDVTWQQGDAADLPFPDADFDVVLCQSALMFFPDRAKALSEMARVVTSQGTVAVQVWGSLESQPGYGPFIGVAARHAGPEAIDLLGSYWTLGDLDLVGSLFEAAGLEVTSTRTEVGRVRVDSIESFVRTEVESTPLAERISTEVHDRVVQESREVLGAFVTKEGRVEIPIVGHVVVAQKP